jgi:hypothetical protein
MSSIDFSFILENCAALQTNLQPLSLQLHVVESIKLTTYGIAFQEQWQMEWSVVE